MGENDASSAPTTSYRIMTADIVRNWTLSRPWIVGIGDCVADIRRIEADDHTEISGGDLLDFHAT